MESDVSHLCPHQEAHPDYSDILKATAAFKNLVVSLEESYTSHSGCWRLFACRELV